MSEGGFTAYVVGEHCCTTSVETTARSGIPVAAPALFTALRASSPLSLESMKSTATLRPARPPLALVYLAQPFTPSTEPWKMPGASELSTSATTAMRIVVSLTPTSVAAGFSPLAAAALVAGAAMAQGIVATGATQRAYFT